MFDIFCHRITFVFDNTQVEINDLLDFLVPGDAPHKLCATEIAERLDAIKKVVDPKFSIKKQGLVDKLSAILDRRKIQSERDSITKKSAREAHKKDRPI